MPDVFISYKKEERETAARLATRLTEAGYDVWWDAALLAGDRFEDEIATVLRSSRAVIVLWSKLSVGSDWVKAEAESARAQKKALPAVIDDLPMDHLPLLFRGVHTVRLGGWDGDAGHAGYRELLAAVSERLGEAAGPHLTAPQAEEKLAHNVSEAEVWAAIAASPQPSAEEYRSYLKRFGTQARFAELAQIRIARLEAADRDAKAPPVRARFRWAPTIVIPLLALAIIAGTGTWFWSRGDLAVVEDWLVPAETKEAAARCSAWASSGDTEWRTTLPRLTATAVADCEAAVKGFPRSGDYKGMLAAALLVQGPEHAGRALVLVHQGKDQGSPVATNIHGVMYLYGLGLNADTHAAATQFKTAAGLGSADAAARLCALAENNGLTLPFSATRDEVYAYCTNANDAGSPLAQAMMGYIHEFGDFGRVIDPVRAVEFYERAVAQGSPIAKIALGAMLFRGIGVTRDDARAILLFEQARSAGYPEAMRWLGIAGELGRGVPQSYAIASQHYEQANWWGDTISQFLIGLGIASDPERGDFTLREMGRLTADPTSPIAARVNGLAASLGFYVERNADLARFRFESCADTNAFCALALGGSYKYGPPQSNDLNRARELFETAANAGVLHAQFELALMYELGQSVPVDLNEAVRLYQLAYAQGSQAAGERLRLLTSSSSPKS